MSMEIDSCLFEGTHDYASAYMGSDEHADGCQVIDYDTFASASHGLQACGASMEYVAEDGAIVFKSVMHIPSSTKEGGIFTTQPIDWTFQCSYDTSYDITADQMSMDASAKTGEFSGFGQFDLSMSFYSSETFDVELSSADPYNHQVGKSVAFGVQFNHGQQLTGLSFAPTSCEIVNVENPTQTYQLWDSTNGLMCDSAEHPVDFTVQQSPNAENLMKQFFGLSYTGFAFDSVTNDIGQQLLKCHIEICHDDTDDSMCKTGCFEEPTPEPIIEDLCLRMDTAVCKHKYKCMFTDRVLPPGTAVYDENEEISEPDNYFYEHNHSAGETIQLSRLCTSDWKKSGDNFKGENELGCAYYAKFCRFGMYGDSVYKSLLSNEAYITQRLHKMPDGSYATFLNCPICGCTEGTYDTKTFEEIACHAGDMSDHEHVPFFKEGTPDFSDPKTLPVGY